MENTSNGQKHILDGQLVRLATEIAKKGGITAIVEERRNLLNVTGVYIGVPNGTGAISTYYIPGVTAKNFEGVNQTNTQEVIDMVKRQEGCQFIGFY